MEYIFYSTITIKSLLQWSKNINLGLIISIIYVSHYIKQNLKKTTPLQRPTLILSLVLRILFSQNSNAI